MNLSKIKNKLDSIGYYTYSLSNFPNELIVGRDLGGTNFDAYCTVMIHGNEIRIIYGNKNIQNEEFVDSEAKVISFIKKEFPL